MPRQSIETYFRQYKILSKLPETQENLSPSQLADFLKSIIIGEYGYSKDFPRDREDFDDFLDRLGAKQDIYQRNPHAPCPAHFFTLLTKGNTNEMLFGGDLYNQEVHEVQIRQIALTIGYDANQISTLLYISNSPYKDFVSPEQVFSAEANPQGLNFGRALKLLRHTKGLFAHNLIEKMKFDDAERKLIDTDILAIEKGEAKPSNDLLWKITEGLELEGTLSKILIELCNKGHLPQIELLSHEENPRANRSSARSIIPGM